MLQPIILITLGMTAIISILFFLALFPLRSNKILLSQNNNLDPAMAKLLKMFGGDAVALFPQSTVSSQVKSTKIEKLFQESNNPWKITKQEFFILRVILFGIGCLISFVIFGALITNGNVFLGIILSPLAPLILYNYPVTYYKSEADSRNMKFKSQLPEAIDYLILSLSGGGYSLPIAFEQATEYLQEGIIKDEFIQIISDLRTGKTMEASLESFAERAPTEGIKAFTKALINANKLSVSMTDILRARADASRKELENEIEKRVVTLPTRVTMVLSPACAIAICLVAIAPSVHMLSTMF